jgi:predicted Zn finger-like uncharacterized protein
MMMQCPRCSTRWRVAAAAPVENPLFKCGKCHHLFRQFPGAPSATKVETAPDRRNAAPAADSDTLEFIFPERQPAELLLTDAAAPDPTPPAAAVTPLPAPPAASAARSAVAAASPAETTVVAPALAAAPPPIIVRSLDEATAVIDADDEDDQDDQDDDEAPVASELLADPLDDEPDTDADDDDDFDLDEEPTAEPTAGTRLRVEDTLRAPAGFGTIMQAMGTIVAGFVALALMIRVAPERSSVWLSKVPLAGASFAHDRNLASKIQLTNVHGGFQRLRNARRVFVISGDARNNSPMTIERIEVAGALYGLGGGELDQKVVTTGNRTTLTDLSDAEIVLLQRLDPALALAPGETTPFLIVFLEPPRELREFSSRVLSVRPTRRASSPGSGTRGSVG